MSRNTQLACIIAVLVSVAACSSSPTAPSNPASRHQGQVASADVPLSLTSNESTAVGAASLQQSVSPAAVQGLSASCTPTIAARTPTSDPTFLVLTVGAPAACRWFIHDVESGTNFWELTAAAYDLRNRQKYPNGVGGAGTQQVGAHFLKKIGYQSYRTLTLEVCSGVSCGPSTPRWTWRYTIAVP